MADRDGLAARVATVRAFNRFYTNLIGVLHASYLDSGYSVSEARVLYEIAQADVTDAGSLRRTLDLDAGYLSRILGRLEGDGVVSRERSAQDGRRQDLRLTARGRAVFATLDQRSQQDLQCRLEVLDEPDQGRLVEAMATILALLADRRRPSIVVLRAPRPGDLGWVVERHGRVYAGEYGWDAAFEALVARIVADYAAQHDPQCEAAWIAEVDGEPAGSVLCVRRDERTAQLRLLLVEPRARGLGVGTRLVEECIRFARAAGYKELRLWTNDVLTGARRIYDRAGFREIESERHHSFGHDLVGQVLALDL